KLRDDTLRREEATREYHELASAARMARTPAAEQRIRAAWTQFCQDYPDLIAELDTQGLEERFGGKTSIVEPVPAGSLTQFTLPLLEWIDIPAGKVILEGGAGAYRVEPFAISKYPVTNAQFQAFIDDGGYEDDRWWQNLEQRMTGPEQPGCTLDDH